MTRGLVLVAWLSSWPLVARAQEVPVVVVGEVSSPAPAQSVESGVSLPEVPPPPVESVSLPEVPPPPVASPPEASLLAVPPPPALEPPELASPPPSSDAAEHLASPASPPRAYPARLTERPLTLPAGRGRIDNGLGLGIRGRVTLTLPVGAAVGITDDLEAQFAYPIGFEPSVGVLGRVLTSPVFELGVRGQLTFPTESPFTSVRIELPILVRPLPWLRLTASPLVDVALGSQPAPIVALPMQLTFGLGMRMFVGVLGVVRHRHAEGLGWEAGPFVGSTFARTATGPIGDARIYTGVVENGRSGFGGVQISVLFSFYPRFVP